MDFLQRAIKSESCLIEQVALTRLLTWLLISHAQSGAMDSLLRIINAAAFHALAPLLLLI